MHPVMRVSLADSLYCSARKSVPHFLEWGHDLAARTSQGEGSREDQSSAVGSDNYKSVASFQGMGYARKCLQDRPVHAELH